MEDAPSRKTLPHDQEAEQAVLGAIMIDPRAINTAMILVTETDFYRPRHQIIYRTILELNTQGVELDTVTISSTLKNHGLLEESGGVDYLSQLVDGTPTSANLEYYATIVRKKSIQRSLIQAAGDIAEMAFDSSRDLEDVSNSAERRLFEVTDRNLTKSYEDIQPLIHRSIGIIQQFRSGGLTGLESGFSGLDKLTSGFQGGQLVIIAGRPSMGKTAFCINMATRVAIKTSRPVLIFSLEMQKEELVLRMFCSEGKIEGDKLKKGLLSKRDMQVNLMMAADRLYKTNIIIDDKPNITVNEARAKARRIKNEKGDLAMIVFDYIQLVDGPSDIPRHDRYAIISDVSRSLKHLAKELNVPVIALSQLSRKIEERTNRTPLLSDLRESGQLEQDADIVAFIHRNYVYSQDEEERNKAHLLVRKQRNGPTGDVPLVFFGEYMRFEDGVPGS